MIERFRAYAEMKDSGAKWFSHVPAHWACVPLVAVASPKSVTDCPERELLSVYLNRGVVRFSDIAEKRTNATSSDLSKYQAVDPGDFVLNNQQAWRGSVGVSQHAGIVSPAYLVLSLASALHPQYANYLFRDKEMVSQYLVCSKGVGSIQRNLYWPQLKRSATLVPPIEEQEAIARYLHAMDRRIARFIRNRQRLIEVLNEQKQAIINRAVTCGLNPNTPLKPSGIDWLGDIPADWEVLRGKYLFREVDTRSRDGSETHLSMSQKFGLVPASQLNERHFHSSSYAGGKLVHKGDIVLNRLKAHLGVFRLAGQDGVISPDYTVLRPIHNHSARYFELVLASSAIRPELKCRVKGLVVGFWRLYTDDFYDIQLPVPPVQDQLRIVKSCQAETAELDAAIRAAEREIDLIREYRTRLISDVVTGNVDVRHLAPLPGSEDLEERAEALEPLEKDVAADMMDDEESIHEAD